MLLVCPFAIPSRYLGIPGSLRASKVRLSITRKFIPGPSELIVPDKPHVSGCAIRKPTGPSNLNRYEVQNGGPLHSARPPNLLPRFIAAASSRCVSDTAETPLHILILAPGPKGQEAYPPDPFIPSFAQPWLWHSVRVPFADLP